MTGGSPAFPENQKTYLRFASLPHTMSTRSAAKLVYSSSLALLIALTMPLFVSSAGFAAPTQPASAALMTAPVYIHFNSKSYSVSPGGNFTGSATATNKGSFSATATGCKAYYRLGTSGPWTQVPQCGLTIPFPFTLPAHTSATKNFNQTIPKGFPAGNYQWKVIFFGTYNGVASKSHSGKFTLAVT
jgi:hypothetical protein